MKEGDETRQTRKEDEHTSDAGRLLGEVGEIGRTLFRTVGRGVDHGLLIPHEEGVYLALELLDIFWCLPRYITIFELKM